MGKTKGAKTPWTVERLSITSSQNSSLFELSLSSDGPLVILHTHTHTHWPHYELIRLASRFKHFVFLQLKTFLKVVNEKLMRKLAIIIYAQLAYRLGSSAFKDRVRLVASLLSELWELGILFFQEPLLTQNSLTCDFSPMHTTGIKLGRLNCLWLLFTTVELFSVLSVIGQ